MTYDIFHDWYCIGSSLHLILQDHTGSYRVFNGEFMMFVSYDIVIILQILSFQDRDPPDNREDLSVTTLLQVLLQSSTQQVKSCVFSEVSRFRKKTANPLTEWAV